jgi:nucleoid DNA-binding protein
MSLQISVTTGKSEEKRTAAGLVRRTETDHADKAAQSSVSELISGIFEQVKSSLESEANVEVEITANLELAVKDGKTVLNLDVSGENPNARTLRLKFSTTINPSKGEKKSE